MSLFSFIYYNDYFLFYNCLVISSFLYIYETILNHMQSIHLANRYIFFKKYFIKSPFALIQEISHYRNIKKTHNHIIHIHICFQFSFFHQENIPHFPTFRCRKLSLDPIGL